MKILWDHEEEKSMSSTYAPHVIAGAIKACEQLCGASQPWQTVGNQQREFMNAFYARCVDDLGEVPEVKTFAAWTAPPISAFLAENGFPDIKIPNFQEPNLGAAGVMNVGVSWKKPGKVITIKDPKEEAEYPGVELKRDQISYLLEQSKHPHPIVQISTRSGDQVFMSVVDEELRETEVLRKAMELALIRKYTDRFSELRFPMVDLQESVNLAWLAGMSTQLADGRSAIIGGAIQQTRFRMNQIGARAESAAVIYVTRGGSLVFKQPYTIDRPFLLWIDRGEIYFGRRDREHQLNFPLFAAYITPEHWKDPGDIGV
ncbi:MAG: hypothetical protein HYZ08_01970 [Candidatus Kerfeldbacteria bacterium]|nr:hypothetical protein [Candidatus Kerfeldbacteria bacterium]